MIGINDRLLHYVDIIDGVVIFVNCQYVFICSCDMGE